MSALSELWRAQRHRWYRRGIAKEHALRRHLAYYVARRGFKIGEVFLEIQAWTGAGCARARVVGFVEHGLAASLIGAGTVSQGFCR